VAEGFEVVLVEMTGEGVLDDTLVDDPLQVSNTSVPVWIRLRRRRRIRVEDTGTRTDGPLRHFNRRATVERDDGR
jgi:ribosomal protein L39E